MVERMHRERITKNRNPAASLIALLLPGALAIVVAGGFVASAGRAATSPATVGIVPADTEGEDTPGGSATTRESTNTRDAFSRFSTRPFRR
jgi:hypothetical protein